MKRRYRNLWLRQLFITHHKRRAYRRSYRRYTYLPRVIGLILMSLIINLQTKYLVEAPQVDPLDKIDYDVDKIAAFQVHQSALKDISQYADEKKLDFYDVLISTLVAYDFQLLEWEVSKIKEEKVESKEVDQGLRAIYKMILEDIQYFPIPDNMNESDHTYHYIDSWKAERTYGGERLHYGTDIMDNDNQRGYYPIISITAGTVEKIGWLEKGGYRIGIRGPSGAYFYYAHLYDYSEDYKVGDQIQAGQLLGFMGDSGYGIEEGTVGQFPVHLHIGISLPLINQEEEFWINPYWLLKYLEENKIKSWY